ncbi:MAG: RNA 3'-terminal-phosphate cyclase [Betaproteobacteria bacterium RIFCSPLOWO2_12_FULL_62_13]|nr:MAG: RNA 3'-terminal-phosphate cyclase [Betaproteobacteria bacterium RIFCSPLOWO2_12_FULL_62_13]
MIEIDGSYGEGGGQLARTAVALSAITGRAIRLVNVRAKRDKAGLAPQHLAAVRAVGEVCGATTEGLELRSTSFRFSPGPLKGGMYRFDVGTAGSVTLVLQAALPPLLACGEGARVIVTGGTDVRQAPPVDYLTEVILRHLARMGAKLHIAVLRRGYYPRGGGEVAVEISATKLRPVGLPAPGVLRQLEGVAHVANLPASIADRMRGAALAQFAGIKPGGRIASRVLGGAEAIGQGGAIVAWAQTEHTVLGAARVAERGVRAEALGEAVGRELRADLETGATADVHAADQLLVFLALAGGESAFTTRELSSHAHTAMWLIGQFLPARFAIERDGALYRVRVMP